MNTIKLDKPLLPGWATLEYDNGITSFDPSTLSLHLEPEQKDSYVSGNVLRERLSNEMSANFATLQYLKKHPELLPDDWKGKYIFGWGTVVRNRVGDLLVPCLIEDGGQVGLRWHWLVFDWHEHYPALRFASQSSTLKSSEGHSEPQSLSDLEQRLAKVESILKHHNLTDLQGFYGKCPHKN